MKRSVIAIVIAAAVSLLPASAQTRHLSIIHFNDTHSHIEPERAGDEMGNGGVIERAAYVDSVRRVDGKRNVLLLHGGDFGQGTPYFTEFGGDIEVELHNALGYDVTTLGNHEFDNGLDELARRLKNLKAKVVCANYDFSKFEVGKYIEPWTIVRRGGMKIGVIGLLTDVSTVVAYDVAKDLHFLDPVVVVDAYADYLKNKKHCDMVIVLSHLGYREDCDLASKVGGVDLVVGGHSHTYLKDITYVNSKDGVPTPVVQNGCWGLEIGHLKVYPKTK